MIRFDQENIEAARRGSRAALEAVVRAAERPVYNLALRMLADRTDAEDATQEILIKLVTHLGSLREVGAAGAWALRIACRHLVETRRRSRVEAMRLTFRGFAANLEDGLAPLAGVALEDAETALAIEEVKVGCTLAMLTCLKREARIAYLLGDVFEMTDAEATSVLDIRPDAYRQRLRRAREAVRSFVAAHCGIVSENAACRCERRVCTAITIGRIRPGRSDLGIETTERTDIGRLRAQVDQLEEGRRAAAVMRSNPDFLTRVGELVCALIDRDELHG
jgi:RNA polymerase sigma factor (sigma-70 family)